MQYSRLQHTLDGADVKSPMQATRMGRLLLYIVALIVAFTVVRETWGGSSIGDVTAAPTAAAGTTEQSLQQQPSSTVQGIPLAGLPAYKHYWVGNSSIPGAGLGVFARTHMPAGTIWSPEDAEPDNTIFITLRQWQALIGIEEHLRQAGHTQHAFSTLCAYFEEYPYICSDYFIASLTGTTFTNHAPTAPPASKQQTATSQHHRKLVSAASAQLAQQPQSSAGSNAAARLKRFANSVDVSPEMASAQGLSDWQICTLAVTAREIQAGEELLEDYAAFNTPCTDSHKCPDFLTQQQQQQQAHGVVETGVFGLPHDEWNRAVLVQSLDIYVGPSSSSSRPGGGLGVFAARDLPAGTVWNKEDAAHSLAVTRGQWNTLYRLDTSLAAARVRKPGITALVRLLQQHGIYCPLDDRVYLPLSHSLLAQQATANSHAQGSLDSSSSSSEGGKQETREGRQTRPNSKTLADGDTYAGVAAAAGAAARCLWQQTVVDVRQGEELVVAPSLRQQCDWAGFQQSTS